MESEDFPDTQPVEDQEVQESQALSPNQEIITYWGRLYPLVDGLRPYDLVENDLCFNEKSFHDVKESCSFSDDTCFQIRRKSERQTRGLFKTVTEIVDKSKRGILINDRQIQRITRISILHNNSKISLPHRTGGHYDAYVFVDSLLPASNPIFPNQVTTHYQITYRLGAGAFGEVFLAFNKTTFCASAVKSVVKSGLPNNAETKKPSKLINELAVLRYVNHPHVIRLLDVVECKGEYFIFLEFMEGKDLSERIRQKQKLQENIAKLYFYQLSKAVAYLHKQGIVHRDIKPANVLLASANSETIVKLTDFGLSKILTSKAAMKTVCGTKMYAAPEVLSGKGQYTGQVDIWSMGVLLYTCLSGTEPFSVQPHLIEQHIMKSLYVMLPETWRNISIFAKNLIDTMLLTDPSQRIGINEILKDVWLQDAKMFARLKRIYTLYGLESEDT